LREVEGESDSSEDDEEVEAIGRVFDFLSFPFKAFPFPLPFSSSFFTTGRTGSGRGKGLGICLMTVFCTTLV